MTNYKIIVQYDGTRYQGWQRQKTTDNTIQGKLESILSRKEGSRIDVHGAGRTDAGVHALAQVANFQLDSTESADQVKAYINEYLPEDIRILKCVEASPRFHSRLNAVGKIYEYCILKADQEDVFQRNYQWKIDTALDLAEMQKAAKVFLGSHDFFSFCTKASKKKSTVRVISRIEIQEDEKEIRLRFEGNGFLYNMVRILVGTLVEVGQGTRTIESIENALRGKDRELAGEKAPAKGLRLREVIY